MSRLLVGPGIRLRAGTGSLAGLGRSFGIRRPDGSRAFNPPLDRPGANAQFERFWNEPFDFAKCVTDPYSFKVWRNQSVWMRADGDYPTWWHQAHRWIKQLRRSSTDATVLEIVCAPQSYQIAVGEPFIMFRNPGWDGGVSDDTTWDFSGLSVPLKQKLTVVGCYAEAGSQNSVVQVRFPGGVPDAVQDITAAGGWITELQAYHWNFYLDQNKTMRWHTQQAMDKAFELVKAGGWFIWGGLQQLPTWKGWSRFVAEFGPTLVQELRTQEFEYVGTQLANPPAGMPADYVSRWLIEDENEPNPLVADPTWEEANRVAANTEFQQWAQDWIFPAMRKALPDFTLCLGGIAYNALDDMARFTPSFPDTNWWLKVHAYNGVGTWMDFGDDAQAQQIASEMAAHARTVKAAGFALTEFSVDNVAFPVPGDRAAALGRVLTAMRDAGGHTCYWAYTGDFYTTASRESDGVLRLWPELRTRAAKAGTYNA